MFSWLPFRFFFSQEKKDNCGQTVEVKFEGEKQTRSSAGEGSSARNSSARKNCSTPKSRLLDTVRADDKSFLSTARKRNVVHVRHTFVYRAVDSFCVEQMTFLKKVLSSWDSSRCNSSSWPWLHLPTFYGSGVKAGRHAITFIGTKKRVPTQKYLFLFSQDINSVFSILDI